jgi:GNAT superfamily N-acetyltransferase
MGRPREASHERAASRHPEHDAVSNEVRSWYTVSTPSIGLEVVSTDYGFLAHSESRAELKRLVLTVDTPGEVAPAIRAAGDSFGTQAFDVWVDDRARADRLSGALASAGLEPDQSTVVLALVGDIRADRRTEQLTFEDVTDLDQLSEWAAVKIQGFADTEDPPTRQRLDGELANRRAEWPVCRYQLARLDGEGVAILGHYTGGDQMVFSLATRLPFRHRGIAQTMLARWSREGDDQSVRSRLINCDDGGPADALYRRLGFVDEVYWHRRYRASS